MDSRAMLHSVIIPIVALLRFYYVKLKMLAIMQLLVPKTQ